MKDYSFKTFLRVIQLSLRTMPKTSSHKLGFLLPIAFFSALGIGFYLGHRSNPWQMSNEQHREIIKLNGVLNYIEQNYVDSIDRNELVNRTIISMLEKLDPHSNYIPAENLQAVNERLQGRFEGIGVRFMIHRDTLVVTTVVANGPSERTGVMAGDRIYKVDKENITDGKLTNEKVMELLKGPSGSTVKLDILRKGKEIQKTILRGYVPVSSVDAVFMVDHETGYIRITQFGEPTYREFMNAATKLMAQGMRKLVLDLRDNGGGYLTAATEIADEFLPEGALIVYTQGNARKKQITYSKRNGNLIGIDVAVLINEHSASASEIVAGALQDNDRGTIMGRRSFGKGLVQEQHQWEDGSAIRLTIARYYTPTGRSIQRPYGNDVDYDGDLLERYERGELYAIDSSLFVDSLKYVTAGGKVVYGGGGIMPDVFLPLDTTGYSEYAAKLRYRDVFNHFAFEMLDSERGKITAFGYKKFANEFHFGEATLLKLAEYGFLHHNVAYTKEKVLQDKTILEQYLKAYISRQIWEETGFIYTFLQLDKELGKALDYLKSK